MTLLRYITHANVEIDPEVPVPQWSLSAVGAQRIHAMLAQPWVASIGRVVSSAETKAIETATILADHVGLSVEIREHTGETDRSATGYVPHDRHEELANLFFAHPSTSAEGWERAVDVQQRMVHHTADLVVPGGPNTALIGHGAAGTLLYCHLAKVAIDRAHDQQGGGHYWTWDTEAAAMLHGWHAVDVIEGDERWPS